MQLQPLPADYRATREAIHALACYVLGPARKAADGHIGLRATGDGIGTPTFGDAARRLVVRGHHLCVEEGGHVVDRIALSTLRSVGSAVGVEVSADPGVGHDLPPFQPDDPLAVGEEAATALACWYAFADMVLVDVREGVAKRGTCSAMNLWPEHFDLAFDFGHDDEDRANIGASPGDAGIEEPYLYVGPWAFDGRTDDYWNAPFGAVLRYSKLLTEKDPKRTAVGFVIEGLARLGL